MNITNKAPYREEYPPVTVNFFEHIKLRDALKEQVDKQNDQKVKEEPVKAEVNIMEKQEKPKAKFEPVIINDEDTVLSRDKMTVETPPKVQKKLHKSHIHDNQLQQETNKMTVETPIQQHSSPVRTNSDHLNLISSQQQTENNINYEQDLNEVKHNKQKEEKKYFIGMLDFGSSATKETSVANSWKPWLLTVPILMPLM